MFEKLKMQGELELKKEWLKPYEFYLRSLAQTIPDCKFQHLPKKNQMTGALATLAATWENPKKLMMRSFVLTAVSKPAYETDEDVEVDDRKLWHHDVQRYLEHREFSKGENRKDKKLGKMQ